MPFVCGKQSRLDQFGSRMGKHLGARFALDMYEKNQIEELDERAHTCVESSRSNPTAEIRNSKEKVNGERTRGWREFPGQEHDEPGCAGSYRDKKLGADAVVGTNLMLAEPQLS